MATLIPEGEVSVERIKKLFEQAFFKAELDDDGDIYIKEGLELPIWVTINSEQSMIKFFTFIGRYDDDEMPPFKDKDSNDLNKRIVLPSFYTFEDNQRVFGNYFMTYADGVVDSHIINMARRFSSAFAYGVRLLEERKPVDPLH